MSDTTAPSGDMMPHSMAPASGQAIENRSSRANGGRDDPHHKKANARKRTKTGCLTCRKRRIKCDEGRPTCNNCVKSKRHCEGYNQRVVFKDPFRSQAHPLNSPYGHLGFLSSHGHPLSHLGQLHGPGPESFSGHLPDSLAGPSAGSLTGPLPGRPGGGALPSLAPKPPSLQYVSMQQGQPHGAHYLPQTGHATFLPATSRSDYTAHGYQASSISPLAPAVLPAFGSFEAFAPPGPQSVAEHKYNGLHIRAADFEKYHETNNRTGAPMIVAHSSQAAAFPTQARLLLTKSGLDEGEVWDEDSDDEHESSMALVAPVVNRLYTPGVRDTSIGTFNEFANSNAVSEYMSAPGLSELKDSAKRDIFEHFMRVTGPSMSLYERHPFDESQQQAADFVPGSGTNIWSYTFPVLAFQHSGLLNAILASASLQLAKLQGTPPTAAIKHNSIALRRIAKSVRTPAKRKHPATLAATLLLGYYEVWNGEHNTWCNHLYGASILLAEMQLKDLSKRCLPIKVLRDREAILKKMGLYGLSAIPQDPNQLDFSFLSSITGYHIDAADYGLADEQIYITDHTRTTERDLRDYDNLRDLFWWYCKMDVYQGILGGTPLFMDYGKWTECLPRASFSRLDRIYGTYDHLMLLIGRLVSFASKDLSRKRRDNRPSGGSMAGPFSPPWPGMIPTKGEFRAPMGFSPPKEHIPQPDPTEGMDADASFKFALDEWEAISHAFALFEHNLGPEFQPLSSEFTDRRDDPFGLALQYRTFSVAGIWMNYYMGLIHLHRSHPRMPPSAMPSVGLAATQTSVYANRIGRIAVGLAEDFGNVQEVSTLMAAALIESAFCLFVAAVQYRDDSQRRWVVKRMLDITRLTGWQSARQIAEGCEAGWTKSAEMGLGPQYKRVAMPPADPETVWHNVRRIDRKIHEVDDRSDEKRLILARSERAHYALGLLGIEDDIEYLELQDHAFSRQA